MLYDLYLFNQLFLYDNCVVKALRIHFFYSNLEIKPYYKNIIINLVRKSNFFCLITFDLKFKVIVVLLSTTIHCNTNLLRVDMLIICILAYKTL